MTRSKREGYILIVTCLALLVITGIAGLAVDVGRMYIVKGELQSLADSQRSRLRCSSMEPVPESCERNWRREAF